MASHSKALSRQSLVNLTFFFTFLPFARILPGTDAKIQPICALFALTLVALHGARRHATTYLALAFAWVITFYLFLSGTYISVTVAVFQYVAYLAPIVTFIALKDHFDAANLRIYEYIFYIYLVVGLLQFSGLFDPLAPIINRIIPVSGVPFELLSVRGLAYLSPEPSNAAFILIQMIIVNHYYQRSTRNSRGRKIARRFLVGLLIMAVLNKSGTMLMFLLVFYGGYALVRFLLKAKLRHVIIAAVIITASVAIISYAKRLDRPPRFLGVALALYELVIEGGVLSPSNWYLLSGPRFIQDAVGFMSLGENAGLGHGVGASSRWFQHYATQFDIDWGPYWTVERIRENLDKPASYASQISLETGIAGLAILLTLLLMVFALTVRAYRRKYSYDKDFLILQLATLGTASAIILLRSTTAMPAAWVLLALVYHHAVRRKVIQGRMTTDNLSARAVAK